MPVRASTAHHNQGDQQRPGLDQDEHHDQDQGDVDGSGLVLG